MIRDGLPQPLAESQYEDKYRLCFLRDPEGFLIELAEQLR